MMQVSRHWRLNAQRYTLQGVTCPHCANNIFPPREICPYCCERTDQASVEGQHERRPAAMVASAAFQAAR